MARSRLQMCPRGFGRTSYHLAEAIQMGLAPVHVWLDRPWVPYPDTVYPRLGYDTDVFGVFPLLFRLSGLAQVEGENRVNQGKSESHIVDTRMMEALDVAVRELERKEAYAVSVRDSHFSSAGVIDQIAKFLMRPGASVPFATNSTNEKSRKLSRTSKEQIRISSRNRIRIKGGQMNVPIPKPRAPVHLKTPSAGSDVGDGTFKLRWDSSAKASDLRCTKLPDTPRAAMHPRPMWTPEQGKDWASQNGRNS